MTKVTISRLGAVASTRVVKKVKDWCTCQNVSLAKEAGLISVKYKSTLVSGLLLAGVFALSTSPLGAEGLEQKVINLPSTERRAFINRLNSEQRVALLTGLAKIMHRTLDKVTWSMIGEAYWDTCIEAERADLVEVYLQEIPAVTNNFEVIYKEAIGLLNEGKLDRASLMLEGLSQKLYRPDRCHFYLACIRAAKGDLEGQAMELGIAERYYSQLRKRLRGFSQDDYK